ncbi:hypothetical protein NDU88_001210 [Pleurodeles waltl]|uniref:Uncharacterized protein n=1 Tax=Pleurodeles waltl TaxID=8319 RepID=A0AAV7NA53_PLEWA|nr:hypothetical protein NDU88_001210 [Pleurodeles waltl]
MSAKNSFSRSSLRTAYTSFTSLGSGRGGRMREQESEKKTNPLCTRRGLGVGTTRKPKHDHAPQQKPSSLSHRLKEEARLMQEQFEAMERKRKEEQEREAERLRRELARLAYEAENAKTEAEQEANSLESMDPANMNRQTEGEEADTRSQRRAIPARLRRQYKFTEATENLHQGFPATGPITSITSKNPTKNQCEDLDLDLENSFTRYDPSFGRTQKSLTQKQKGPEGKDGRRVATTLRDRKNSLMEELFGPGYSLKSSFSNPHSRALSEEKHSRETIGELSSNALQLGENVPFGDRKLIGQ